MISTKDNLFKCLKSYLDTSVFEYVPLTFLIQSNSETVREDLERFKSVFNLLSNYNRPGLISDDHNDMITEINTKLSNLSGFTTKSGKPLLKLKLPHTHFDGYNMWFLKCTQFNRGRGIYVFNTLEQLTSLINEIDKGLVLSEASDIIQSKSLTKQKNSISYTSSDPVQDKIQSSTFVIQKYIEMPLLIWKRKFDIRVWVLVTHDLKVYFFQEGYLRTS